MPTVTKTIGSGARDFTTLAAWAASLPANLVTDGNSYEGDCFNDSEFTSASNLLNLTGHTTDATHTITLTTGSGQSFRDNVNAQTNALKYNASNGVGIKLTGFYASALDISDDNVFISKLQVTGAVSSGTATAFTMSASHSVVIDGCIFEGGDVGSASGVVTLIGSSAKIRNSLIVQRVTGSANILGLQQGASAYNCTIVAPSDLAAAPTNGLNIVYSTSTVENCAIFGATNAKGGAGTVTFTTSMTDVTGTTGLTGSKTYANQFQNTADATRDFRAKAAADILDAGTTDTTNGTPDIVGTARPQGSAYDIGAWELVTAAPPAGPSNVYFDVIF